MSNNNGNNKRSVEDALIKEEYGAENPEVKPESDADSGEPGSKRLKTFDPLHLKGEDDYNNDNNDTADNNMNNLSGEYAPDSTALAADIAAALPLASGSGDESSNHQAIEIVATTTLHHSPPEDPAERQKSEIRAALEKVKEENLKKEPSISTLVTEGLWGDDVDVVEDALTDIANLSFGNPNAGPNRITISLTGGLLAIVKALQRFPNAPELQAAGGRALQNLALDQNNKSGIASSGGIDVLVRAMKEFPDHEGVQLGGCGTFQNLVWGNDENRMRLLKAGGIPVIVKAMNRHKQSAELQEWACGTVYLLSAGEPVIKDVLFEQKAPTALASALENHRGDGAILEKGRNALARLLWQ